MRKTFFSTILLLLVVHISVAQNRTLFIKSGDKGLYLEHKIVAKESFFSIGRLYNVHPKLIASFNKVDMTKGLSIDQKLRIPLTDTNFIQTGNKGTPVYYKADEKIGLTKVSKENNNVSLSNLKNWNNLSTEEINKGTKLIVGFLKTNEMPAIAIVPTTKNEEPVAKLEEKPKIVEPIVEEKPIVQIEEKPKAITPPVNSEKLIERVIATEQGFFKSHFEQQIKASPITKEETVTSGIFKTTSGWQDAKYYLLIDKIAPGTIIKVINPVNNKVVFAKVLGEMIGIRQNEGLNIRISNAAASVLGITEQDKFILKVNY